MDEAVIRSLARWPDVPACYGWLSLDRRGRWRLQGDVVSHVGFAEFISRNYQHDSLGRWFFQNGPQQVFVRLDYTPWVFGQVPNHPSHLISHTGVVATPMSAWIDEAGALLVDTDIGVGLVASQDLVRLADSLSLDASLQRGSLTLGQHTVAVEPIRTGEVAARFGFEPAPHV